MCSSDVNNIDICDIFHSRIFSLLKGMLILSTAWLFGCYLEYAFLASYAIKWLIILGTVFIAAFLALLCHLADRKGEAVQKPFYAVFFSIFVTYAQGIYIDTSNALIWVLLFSLFCYALRSVFMIETERRVDVVSLVLGILFGTIVFIGFQLRKYERLEFLYFSRLDSVLLYSLAWWFQRWIGQIVTFTLLLRGFCSWALRFNRITDKEKAEKNQRKGVFFAFLGIILLCWLPYIIVYCPGITSADSLYELEMQLGLSPVENRNPIIHQWMIRLCVEAAKFLGRGNSFAVALYSVLQMGLMALVGALAVCCLRRVGVARSFQLILLAFFALFPVNGYYSISMWKDIPFAGATLLLISTLVYESLNENKMRFGKEFLSAVVLTVTAFFFCVFRHNGYYAFLFGFPLFIVFSRKKWGKMIVVFIATLLLFQGYQAITTGSLKSPVTMKISTDESVSAIQSGGAAYTVAVQQIARVVYQYGADSDEEFDVLGELFDDVLQLGEHYKSYLADPVMHHFKGETFHHDPARYTKAWLSLCLKHPLTYLESFLLQSYGYWYPNVQYWIVINEIDPNEMDIHFADHFGRARQGVFDVFIELSQNQPVTFLFSIGLMVWILFISAALLILKGYGETAAPMMLLLGVWLTTLLSPVFAEYRYVYGLILCAPFFLILSVSLPAKHLHLQKVKSE